MMKRYRWVVVVVALVVGLAVWFIVWRSHRSEILAEVDGDPISTQEFTYRYWEYLKITGIKDNLATRHMILRNMLNERLILHDARRLGWEQSAEYKHQQEDARMNVILDAYSSRTIGDTVTVGEDEIRRAFSRSRTQVAVRHLYAKTEEEARQYKQMLERGQTFESLARVAFKDPRLASNGGYLGYVGMDDLEPAFENAAFSLPVGVISDPVRTSHGYSIIKVEKRLTLPLASQMDFENQRTKLTRDLKAKKIMDRNLEFARTLVDERAVKFNNAALDAIFDSWGELNGPGSFTELPDSTFQASHDPRQELLLNGTTRWSVGDFLSRLAYTVPKQRNAVHSVADLRELVLGLLTRDAILAKAEAAGIGDEPLVKARIAERVNNFVFWKWRDNASDTVEYQETMPSGLSPADQETWRWRHNAQEQLFQKKFESKSEIFRFPDEVRVREILMTSSPQALEVMKESMSGKPFDQLARKYSRRPWAAIKGGDMGYHAQDEYGPMGDRIFSSRPGTIFGPVPVDSGFSIIQVLDRRPGREKTFEESKEDIYRQLLPAWRDYAFTHALQELEKHCTIKYDTLKLESLPFVDPMKLVQGE